jgi:hypothetical protein
MQRNTNYACFAEMPSAAMRCGMKQMTTLFSPSFFHTSTDTWQMSWQQ